VSVDQPDVVIRLTMPGFSHAITMDKVCVVFLLECDAVCKDFCPVQVLPNISPMLLLGAGRPNFE